MVEERKRRREDPEVRRAQILDAAERSFRASGLQGTTVDRIASEAGVSVGLLYRFFPSKSAIIEAIVARDIERQLGEIAALLQQASGRPEKLPQLIGEQLANSPIDRERFALLFEISAEMCRNAQLRAFIRARRSELVDALAERVPEWKADRTAAERMVETLVLASSVASGLAMHAAFYSDTPRLSADLVPSLMKTIIERD